MTWLGIDLGTSSVKVAAVSVDGRVLDLQSTSYQTSIPEPGAAEQNPDDWWEATGAAVRAIAPEIRASIRAIGLSGQMHGTVCLDSTGIPVAPAIIWSDTRGDSEARWLTERIGHEALAASVGTALAAGFQSVTLSWMRRHRPDQFSRVSTILLPKDYLRLRMTGKIATEPSDAASTGMLDIHSHLWSDTVIADVGIQKRQLPPIGKSCSVAGRLTAEAQAHLGIRREVPVASGGGDASLAALGSGISRAGQALITLSSGAQVTTFVDRPVFDSRLRVHTLASPLDPDAGECGWYIMGATMSAGTSLRWARDQILGLANVSIETCIDMASEVPVGAGGLIYAPYIAGERTPHLDAGARGALIGLTADHDQRHILRAVLEGTAFAIRDAWDVVLELAPGIDDIVVAGGGARSQRWVQIIADVIDRTIATVDVADASAVGAAIIAATSQTGQPASTIGRKWTPFVPGAPPDPAAAETYAELRPVYQRYYATFANDFPTLRKAAS